MAVARETLHGPRVIRAVAGKTLKFNVAWRNPTTGTIIPSSGYTARLQIRDAKNTRRVLLDVTESSAPNAVLSRYTDSETSEERFLIVLGKSYTSWLPEDCSLECELENETNPDDAVPLFTLLIKVASQEVM